MKYIFSIIFCGLISCQYGGDMYSNLIETSKSNYSPNSGKVELFFENSQPIYKYVQIGFVTVEGGRFDDDNSTIYELKYIAWKKGADAIIDIKRDTKARKVEDVLSDYKDDYSSTVYTGVAIKYVDSAFSITDIDSTLLYHKK